MTIRALSGLVGLAGVAGVVVSIPVGDAAGTEAQPRQVRPKIVKKGEAAVTRVRAGRGTALISADGKTRLKVDPGVLEQMARFSIQEVIGHNDPKIRSATYELGPDGQRFGKPVELCLTVPKRVLRQGNLCLGYFDEASGNWSCQDTCLVPHRTRKPRELVLCGTTDHFTNFAVLLDTSNDEDTCKTTEEDLPMPIHWGGTGSSSGSSGESGK